ncbi:hypothetical protein [Gelidibacter maritimus]|uniref:Uncharacterized protein n=1 Tax=Gelidibacter maritimus TaxID=2761487 RepID=A0A7W2M2R2_9FLAO|nr:hypothetical protein [Gelidibacter maritimus]MBA6151638.1 hypothetical protein [Gelidibacter maritimus]
MKETMNFKAFNFSPIIWWKILDKSIYLCNAFGKEIKPNFSFIEWLNSEVIQNESIDLINNEINFTTDKRYYNVRKNEYFFRVKGINTYGCEVSEVTEYDLFIKHKIDKNRPLTYTFRIFDLNHLALMHLYKWLVFNSNYEWVRWEMYFQFIISKLKTTERKLFIYMWYITLNEINIQDHFFKDVAQYKVFKVKYEELSKQAKYINDKIDKLRKKTNKQ